MPALFMLWPPKSGAFSPEFTFSGFLRLVLKMAACFANSISARITGIFRCVWMSVNATSRSFTRHWTTIIYLLFWGCPAAIVWLVVTIVILAIELQTVARMRTHVQLEGSEGFSPSIAYGDPTSAVPLIRDALRIETAINHRPPRLVKSAFLFVRIRHTS